MQLSQTEFKILIFAIGLIIGVAISFLAWSVSHNPVSFIFIPVCLLIVYFQIVHPIGRKGE